MPKVCKSVAQLIGKTPLLELCGLQTKLKLHATVHAKLECFNPAGSVKDRIAFAMVQDAFSKGVINNSTVLIEPTSGNTGIGLAAVAAAFNLRLILTMPESMSIERRKILTAYGAEVVLTDATKGMKGAIEQAKCLLQTIPNSHMLNQFENPNNPNCHYATTGPEIWQNTGGKVDVFVAGVGTGGTITGAGTFLKQQNNAITIVAVEPEASAVLSGGCPGKHTIQGIGAGFVPKVLDTSVYNKVVTVSNNQALAAAQLVAKTDGILVGISSGAALHAAILEGQNPEHKNKTIVVMFPDSGERYLSIY